MNQYFLNVSMAEKSGTNYVLEKNYVLGQSALSMGLTHPPVNSSCDSYSNFTAAKFQADVMDRKQMLSAHR